MHRSYLIGQRDNLCDGILTAFDRMLSVELYAWPSKTDAWVKEFRKKKGLYNIV